MSILNCTSLSNTKRRMIRKISIPKNVRTTIRVILTIIQLEITVIPYPLLKLSKMEDQAIAAIFSCNNFFSAIEGVRSRAFSKSRRDSVRLPALP